MGGRDSSRYRVRVFLQETVKEAIRLLFSEALKAFAQYQSSIERSPRTIRGYDQDLSMFQRYLESQWNTSVYLSDLRTEDVEAFLLYLKERGTKTSTRKPGFDSFHPF